jgi:hypothetical protein
MLRIFLFEDYTRSNTPKDHRKFETISTKAKYSKFKVSGT